STVAADVSTGHGLCGSLPLSAAAKPPFRHVAELRLTYHAPFDRTRDKLNLKASYLRLNDHQLEFQRQARIAASGDPRLALELQLVIVQAQVAGLEVELVPRAVEGRMVGQAQLGDMTERRLGGGRERQRAAQAVSRRDICSDRGS
ncbi:hypothetical protein LJG11_28975, partial [Pseudomonas aeruginosa]|nr:hypothetical protein [Pseudomonas aeruginosa]